MMQVREEVWAERRRGGVLLCEPVLFTELTPRQLRLLLGACLRCGALDHFADECAGIQRSRQLVRQLEQQNEQLQRQLSQQQQLGQPPAAAAPALLPRPTPDGPESPSDMET